VQGRTLHTHFFHALIDAICDDLEKPIDKNVRPYIKGAEITDIADNLLAAGLTVAHERQVYGEAAIWIGKCLNQSDNEIALRVGSWGINMLCHLPIFDVEKKGRSKIGHNNLLVLHWRKVCTRFWRKPSPAVSAEIPFSCQC
jgi:hypothetical protein